MDGIQSSTTSAQVGGVIKDSMGAQLITKTLDRMNAFRTLGGPAVDAGHQFQKDVLAAAGIGTRLDAVI